jgi:hypothetical protein
MGSDVTIPLAELEKLRVDAARYRWLRNGNGYAPEEAYARGGRDLDRLCDQGIRENKAIAIAKAKMRGNI